MKTEEPTVTHVSQKLVIIWKGLFKALSLTFNDKSLSDIMNTLEGNSANFFAELFNSATSMKGLV